MCLLANGQLSASPPLEKIIKNKPVTSSNSSSKNILQQNSVTGRGQSTNANKLKEERFEPKGMLQVNINSNTKNQASLKSNVTTTTCLSNISSNPSIKQMIKNSQNSVKNILVDDDQENDNYELNRNSCKFFSWLKILTVFMSVFGILILFFVGWVKIYSKNHSFRCIPLRRKAFAS